MNRLYRYHSTPTGQRRMKEPRELGNVSTGATSKDDSGQWVYMSIRFDLADSAKDETLAVQMDRETAARVVKRLTEYLADRSK